MSRAEVKQPGRKCSRSSATRAHASGSPIRHRNVASVASVAHLDDDAEGGTEGRLEPNPTKVGRLEL